MTFNRANYADTRSYDKHIAAWARLEKACEYESIGDMTKARMSLHLACTMELEALGFNNLLKDFPRVEPWDAPRTLN